MIITINGKKYSDYQEGITVMELIEKLNLHKKQIIVELNQLALIKKDYQSLSLKDGDSIEIVQIAAGGMKTSCCWTYSGKAYSIVCLPAFSLKIV